MLDSSLKIENDRLLKGEDCIAIIFDNHEEHIKEHIKMFNEYHNNFKLTLWDKFLIGLGFKSIEDIEKIQTKVKQHVQEHIDYLNNDLLDTLNNLK